MDKRLGLFLYQGQTIWGQDTKGFFYRNEPYEYCDHYFIYDEIEFNLEANNEFRLGPYEMVEW